jgi:hypothetical protein
MPGWGWGGGVDESCGRTCGGHASQQVEGVAVYGEPGRDARGRRLSHHLVRHERPPAQQLGVERVQVGEGCGHGTRRRALARPHGPATALSEPASVRGAKVKRNIRLRSRDQPGQDSEVGVLATWVQGVKFDWPLLHRSKHQ